MLSPRPQWQLVTLAAGVVAVNAAANLLLFVTASSSNVGRIFFLSAITSTAVIVVVVGAVWLAYGTLKRLSIGMGQLARGSYPLLVVPKTKLFGRYVRNFNELSAALRAREEKSKSTPRRSEVRRDSSRAAPEGLIVVDTRNKLRAVDQAAAELLGSNAESLVRMPLDEVERMLQLRAAHRASFDESCAVLHDGKANEVRLELEAPRDGQLRMVRMLVNDNDGNSSEQHSSGLPAPNPDLERMKSEFLSTVSHELRTPLTSIKGSLSLIRSGSSGHIPAEARDLLEIALGNTDRLITTINNVLDMAQLEYGGVQFQVSPVSSGKVINDAIEAVKPEAVTRNAKIETSLPQPTPVVTIDAKRIVQVLTHLLSNAIKFSAVNSRIVVSAAAQGGALVVSVQDFGAGIRPEFMGRLFHKFEHEQDALTRNTQGCGLGLAICKLVVEAHGGRIWVESKEGQGSKFSFSLPLAASPARSILVVDDDDDLHRTITAFCEQRGYRVIACHNARETLQLARNYQPTIVAIDVLAGEGASVEVCSKLAEDERTQLIPVVCFARDQQSQAHAAGANVLLASKPLDQSEFGKLLDQLDSKSASGGA
jgi:signal transduction histidine kinase